MQYLFEDPGVMPALSPHQPSNVCLVMDRVPRIFALVAAAVAQPAGGDDVAFRITSAIDPRVEMLGGALQVASLTLGKVEGRGECFWGLLPHGAAAVVATTGLVLKRESAQMRESRGH